jgi:hypothetical protein
MQLQVENGELRKRYLALRVELGKVSTPALKKRGSSSKATATIPTNYEKHSATIQLISRKAAVFFTLWPQPGWFQHLRRPDIDTNNTVERYMNKKSEDMAMAAELFDYVREQPNGRKLVKLIGTAPWFATNVCR